MVSFLERTLRGEKTPYPPFWFMRQAGRYLPEYRALRAEVPSFLTLCYTPDLAAEVTLQPIRRFDMDAAILFSDILVVPHAMGLQVDFVKGEGPKLSPVRTMQDVIALRTDIRGHLAPVAQTVRQVRAQLPQEKALIGFCGSPWTVACYMVEGQNNGEGWQETRRFALAEREIFSQLIEALVTASADYLGMQIEAGANVVQLFDSWAGVLSEREYRQWVLEPTRALVRHLRRAHPSIPIIGFPRGSGALYTQFALEAGVDALGIDVQTPLAWAFDSMTLPLQGNLDPLLLATDHDAAIAETKRILKIARGKPFVFNLGHGILPHTPLKTVAAVCETIRGSGL